MTVHFYLVRHGQTQLNRHHRLQGITDSPLTNKGMIKASKLGKQLQDIKFAGAYVSDLKRTQETARIILSENLEAKPKIIREPGLREISFGNFEEMKNRHMVPSAIKKLGIKQIVKAALAKKRVTAVANLFSKMDEGAQIEDADQLNIRIERTLSTIGKQYNGKNVNVLIVAHALILSLFIENLSGDVPLFLLKNARVSQVDYENGNFKIVNVNKKEVDKMMNPKTTQLLHELVDSKIVPGVSYTMIQHEKKQSEFFGERQLVPNRVKLTAQLKYDIASLTKVVGTTTVILKLVDSGVLKFDDLIIKFLPAFFDNRVTIRHLLTHTSGISGYIKNRNKLGKEELLKALYTLHVGPTFEKEVVYTDIGMLFLGQVIESIYGMPVQKVIEQVVLQPLLLDSSSFSPKKEECVPTEITLERGLIQGVVHDPKAYILGDRCGSAGLFMPMQDLVSFSRWMINERTTHNYFKSNILNELLKDQTPTKNLGRTYGWDLRINRFDQKCIYHTGYTGTFLLIDLLQKDALIVLTNRVHPVTPNNEFLLRRDQIIAEYLREKDI